MDNSAKGIGIVGEKTEKEGEEVLTFLSFSRCKANLVLYTLTLFYILSDQSWQSLYKLALWLSEITLPLELEGGKLTRKEFDKN